MPVKEHYVRELLAEYAVWCCADGAPLADGAPEHSTAYIRANKKRIEDHFVELFKEHERFFAQVADRIGATLHLAHYRDGAAAK